MASIADLWIVDSNTAPPEPVPSGLVRTLCSPELCASRTLTVYRRTIVAGRRLDVDAGVDYHLLYVIAAPAKGVVRYRGDAHAAEDGAGVLLAPGESAQVEAAGSAMELLHLVVPKPPAAVEQGLPGGPGYFFDRSIL